MGTQLAHSSSYHPQCGGQIEIVKKCLDGYIHCFVSNKQTQWVNWLPLAEWWYNTSFHTAAKMTPFMALYGYHPPSTIDHIIFKGKFEGSSSGRSHRASTKFIQLLKDNLNLAQN